MKNFIVATPIGFKEDENKIISIKALTEAVTLYY